MRHIASSRRLGILILAVLLLPAVVSAQSGGTITVGNDRISFSIDWPTQALHVSITRPVNAQGNAPAAVSRTQAAIRRDAAPLIAQALLSVQLNAQLTLAEFVRESGQTSRLQSIASRATPVDALSDPALQIATVSFRLHLYEDIAASFRSSAEVAPLPDRIGWTAAGEYTGLVIYAPDTLPVFGTFNRSRLTPALLPSLRHLDRSESQIFTLLESSMVQPAALDTVGPVLYHTDESAPAVRRRVGEHPLRVIAIGAFGIDPVDPVLQYEDAEELLASEHNIELLQEGRVVIIVSPDSL